MLAGHFLWECEYWQGPEVCVGQEALNQRIGSTLYPESLYVLMPSKTCMSEHLPSHQFRRPPHPRCKRFTSNHQPKFPPLRLPYLLPAWQRGRFHSRSNHVTPNVLYLQCAIIRTYIRSPYPMHFPSQPHKTESLLSFTNNSEFKFNRLGFHSFHFEFVNA